MQALLQPKVREIDRETERLDNNMEQFKVWVQQIDDLLAKMGELRSHRESQH